MLAMGRLAAAEEALYAAVDARPRSPSPRGALAAYLASRGRFKIAEVLFDEAQRFGASPQAIRAAKERMAPYRAVVADGPAVAIRVSPRVGDPTSITAFVGRFSARGDSLQMFLDRQSKVCAWVAAPPSGCACAMGAPRCGLASGRWMDSA